VALVAACGGSSNKECSLDNPATCASGQVCESFTDGTGTHNACFAPTLLQGTITNAITSAAIPGARVVAIDADSHSAASPVSITDALGHYSVRVLAPRVAGGSKQYTLRVSAAGFSEFPSGIRVALPIKVTFADPKGTATFLGPQNVALSPLAAPPAGSIAGRVTGTQAAGVLVVAEPATGPALSAVSDFAGSYVIFNVPDATYTVRGYFVGQSYTPAGNVVVAGAAVTGVNLVGAGAATGTLHGTLNYVAGAPTATPTTVVLRLKSTGEVPPGLQAPASNATPYQIQGVPDGTYQVLAAFPNDGLVKDPDPGISGTITPTVTFTAGVLSGDCTDCSFKVTDPVAIGGPDAEALVAGNPTFTWSAYPSAGSYRIDVFDSQGNPIANIPNIAAGTTSQTYPGTPALVAGAYYQWRITAFHQQGTDRPISMSEDLRGVWQAR
jgi:hypothetical protein